MKVERTGTTVEVELTRRNLTILLAKLDDPASARTICKQDDAASVAVYVRAVEDDEHYADRAPGEMYMPTSGQSL